jgi:hypothetical protein
MLLIWRISGGWVRGCCVGVISSIHGSEDLTRITRTSMATKKSSSMGKNLACYQMSLSWSCLVCIWELFLGHLDLANTPAVQILNFYIHLVHSSEELHSLPFSNPIDLCKYVWLHPIRCCVLLATVILHHMARCSVSP